VSSWKTDRREKAHGFQRLDGKTPSTRGHGGCSPGEGKATEKTTEKALLENGIEGLRGEKLPGSINGEAPTGGLRGEKKMLEGGGDDRFRRPDAKETCNGRAT